MAIKKKISMVLVMALLGLVMMVPFAHALPVLAGDWINVSAGYGTTGGGEFIVDVSKTGQGGPYVPAGFNTFCLETNEYLFDPMKVASLDKFAIAGGTGGQHPDPISGATAYLYAHYIAGDLDTLSGGAFQYNTDAGANDLQMAIWYLEEELYRGNPIVPNYLVTLGMASDWQKYGYTGNVWVMNTTDPWNQNTQSMLEVVPEPVTLLLLGIGLVGLGLVRRKIS